MQITMHFIRFFNKYLKFITLFISTLFHRKLIGTPSEAHRKLIGTSRYVYAPFKLLHNTL